MSLGDCDPGEERRMYYSAKSAVPPSARIAVPPTANSAVASYAASGELQGYWPNFGSFANTHGHTALQARARMV